MSYREYIGHAVVPVEQDVGVLLVDAGAETAGALSDVLGEVYPALPVGSVDHLHIVFSENGETFPYILVGLFYGDARDIFRIQSYLEVREGHLVQPMLLLEKRGVFAHMRRQTFCDHVDLAVIHLSGHLLIEQQAVENVLVSAQLGHGLLLSHGRVICCSSSVLVFSERAVECPERSMADFGVLFVLIVVLEERISHRVFLPVDGEGFESYIRELQGVVDRIRDPERSAKCREGLLRFRREHMRFMVDKILQVDPAALCHFHRSTEDIIRGLKYLAVHECHGSLHACDLAADLLIALAHFVVGIVSFHSE